MALRSTSRNATGCICHKHAGPDHHRNAILDQTAAPHAGHRVNQALPEVHGEKLHHLRCIPKRGRDGVFVDLLVRRQRQRRRRVRRAHRDRQRDVQNTEEQVRRRDELDGIDEREVREQRIAYDRQTAAETCQPVSVVILFSTTATRYVCTSPTVRPQSPSPEHHLRGNHARELRGHTATSRDAS